MVTVVNNKALTLRAQLYAKIRNFFAERGVLEVETPLLCQHTVTDPHIESFAIPLKNKTERYLQSSPEYAMKRLLVAGSGDIYQICKAFRAEEAGQQHNPEFTMLEWYRLGFDHHKLMDEIDALLQYCLSAAPAQKHTYQSLFEKYLSLNPWETSLNTLKTKLREHVTIDVSTLDYDTTLQVLMSQCIEPNLGKHMPEFVYHFPPEQAALSIIKNGVAERFELYLDGKEIANGFHELTDPIEQEKRFLKNQAIRKNNCQFIPEIDYHFIDALKKGLPTCAGVAVGLDRLVMYLCTTNAIADVLSFPFQSA